MRKIKNLDDLAGMDTVIARVLLDFKKQNQLTDTELLQLVARFSFSCAAWSVAELNREDVV